MKRLHEAEYDEDTPDENQKRALEGDEYRPEDLPSNKMSRVISNILGQKIKLPPKDSTEIARAVNLPSGPDSLEYAAKQRNPNIERKMRELGFAPPEDPVNEDAPVNSVSGGGVAMFNPILPIRKSQSESFRTKNHMIGQIVKSALLRRRDRKALRKD